MAISVFTVLGITGFVASAYDLDGCTCLGCSRIVVSDGWNSGALAFLDVPSCFVPVLPNPPVPR